MKGEETFGGKGVSYCATCDGPFFRNQELVVVGGGDSAIEEATFLTKFATTVHLVHRRNELRASKVMQERALNNDKIKFHWDSAVIDIKGDQKMQQAVLKNLKTNEETTLDVGGLFVAIGHEPNTKLFIKSSGVLMMKDMLSLKNIRHTQTSKEYLLQVMFTTGSYRQAITAAAFGCMAAIDVDKYLTESTD